MKSGITASSLNDLSLGGYAGEIGDDSRETKGENYRPADQIERLKAHWMENLR